MYVFFAISAFTPSIVIVGEMCFAFNYLYYIKFCNVGEERMGKHEKPVIMAVESGILE